MEIMITSSMASSIDPKTLKRWWQTLTPLDGPYPELVLAQRENFYVLIRHWPGNWVALVGEGKYSPIPENYSGPFLCTGELMDYVFSVAERYVRQRDPSFKADWPKDLFGE
jgi:hypothetical protein